MRGKKKEPGPPAGEAQNCLRPPLLELAHPRAAVGIGQVQERGAAKGAPAPHGPPAPSLNSNRANTGSSIASISRPTSHIV